MKLEQAKTNVKALNELSESYMDLLGTTKSTANTLKAAKNLWKEGNKSRLIKIGISLIVFPEPTPISESVGACFLLAGVFQKAVKNRALYLEDITKNFKSELRDVLETSYSVR